MKNINSKAVTYLTILFLCIFLNGFGQNIETISDSHLPTGTIVKGLYLIEIDNESSNYLKEENGQLIEAPLNRTDESFYFWITENVWTRSFQIHSPKGNNKLLEINTDGSAQMVEIADAPHPESNLVFKQYAEGPVKSGQDTDNGIIAIGHIITNRLENNFGNNTCNCNVLNLGNARYKVHKSNKGFSDEYIPIKFAKTENNSGGEIQIAGDHVEINQTLADKPYNFVSSKFFVGGFGANDFKVTFQNGSEGDVGFVGYSYHNLNRYVYANAKPQIGLRAENGVISLFYLSGDQKLPLGPEGIDHEIVTSFTFGSPIIFGFNGQYSLVATQGEKTYALSRTMPAELFLNQSITRSGRMLARLESGKVELSYTRRNSILNSMNDFGHDDGSNFISTNPYFPYNQGRTTVNSFDWLGTKWKVRYNGDNGTVEDSIYSPFYENNFAFSGIAASFGPSGDYQGGEDYNSEEGWELIKANLGYYANGQEKGLAPQVPYVIFYNRVSSLLRVFLYANNYGEANQLTVSLGVERGRPGNYSSDPAYEPKLWGSLQQFKSLDAIQPSWYSKGMPFYSAPGRQWYFTDFTMEYDPCIAFFESSIAIKLNKMTDGDVTMVGRFEGGSLPAGTPEYDEWRENNQNFLAGVMDNPFGNLENTLGDITFNQYSNFDLMKFEESVGGKLIGKEIADWEKEKARIEWQATERMANAEIWDGGFQIAEGVATMAEGAAKMIPVFGKAGEGAAKVVQGGIKIERGIAKIEKGNGRLDIAYSKKLYYDNIKDKTKHSDQEIKLDAPTPRPNLVFGEMALKGKLSIETSIIPNEYIATPGGKNSENSPEFHQNGTRGGMPMYNKPMGNFTMLNQPKFAVGINPEAEYKQKAYLKIKEKPYFAYNNTSWGKINDIVMLSIRVQTLSADAHPRVVNTSVGKPYSTWFNTVGASKLPGEMDISDLVDWEQIQENIKGLANLSDQNIEANLHKWIKISYSAWTLNMTNLKGRNLKRVLGNTRQYYLGETQFAFDGGKPAQTIVDDKFSNYTFGENMDYQLGDRYNLYSTDDDFYTIMETYCNCQKNKAEANLKDAEDDFPDDKILVEEISEDVMQVFPNPATSHVNFNIYSEQPGEVKIGLYSATGQNLITTTDWLSGTDALNGKVNINALQQGFYLLKVELPNGKMLSQKVIKQ